MTATPTATTSNWTEFRRGLELAGLSDLVDDSTLTRALYSSDASLYRIPPRAVAKPRDRGQLEQLVRIALDNELPITPRGTGTSCAGNAVGPGLVIDFRAGLNRIIELDPEQRTAVVEPGVVQADLQRAALPYGLRFGPDPSTHTRCTIGGMIGNNACGPRALGYGKTASNVLGLKLLTGTGDLLRVGAGAEGGPRGTQLDRLQALVQANLATIRTNFGLFDRQVSGYSLEHLLPENGFAAHRFLAGTEGTIGVLTEATVNLVADAPHSIMVALGYPSMPEAADDIPTVLPYRPTAAEGLDSRIVDVIIDHHGPGAVPPLPQGKGWLFIELVDDDPVRLRERAEAVLADSHALDGVVVTDPAKARALWKIREDGAGLAQVSLGAPAYPGWEDAAVRPAQLGAYLRDFDLLLREHGLQGLPYGHFGDGCVHCRIDFPLTSPGGSARYRAFMFDAAALAARYGGSMSGEHGDGRARSELLPIMYNEASLSLMAQVKSIFDPANLLNPGVLVDPDPTDADIRAVESIGTPLTLIEPEFAAAVHRCSGVGKCVADMTGSGGVMCPSYQATGQEKDSTRGRARVLQEMINGSMITDGWRSPEVHEALDLCLSCKGCRRDCPTGTDMASYKAQVLDKAYAGRLRPRSHYTMGWLPLWARLITTVPGLAALVNGVGKAPVLRNLLKWTAGVDQRRPLPQFAPKSAKARLRRHRPPSGRTVIIWVDSFDNAFAGSPNVEAALEVLSAAGYAPQLLQRNACCGLTWISTGQLDGARHHLRQSLDVLHPLIADGTPVIGLEPSCLAVWRSDAEELLPDDPRVPEVAAGLKTLAEFLRTAPEFSPPDLSGRRIIAQPHCHHAAVIGFGPDAELLKRTGAEVTTLGGCCGLAGNFGVEAGHYEVSVKVAEHDLLPALDADPDAIVLADGFSCRLQADQLAGRKAISLAELLADAASGSI
ncbi:FAD-binding and (Fe-S)-binding domain-containing protein [Naumannella halotolerans]|uniref:FAD/FMN-containing dehydrogenase n=1 Tax=Naumannella halotolerans TaxID=993414 RepID=A0A4R7JAU7_9ACTN|nr:FAD-binding and (Fe-S)-binding domain-containing protein [Naumannella halotolerans]TDT34046.1 FAD/FMN-containing dehydrogenase [Naumannella halotolerans]